MLHPNLIQLHELFVESDQAFFTMQLVDGTDLVSWVRSDSAGEVQLSRAGERRFELAARQLIEAMSVVHEHGKLHRDVKPSNVLVSPNGHLVLLDFGLSKPMQPSTRYAEPEQGHAGTLAYMAPELLTGEQADQASDWYSVGALLLQAWTGVTPDSSPLSSSRWNQTILAMQDAKGFVGTVASMVSPDGDGRPSLAEIRASIGTLANADEPPHDDTADRHSTGRNFTGRERERHQLRQLLDETEAGCPVVACVKGPSGIGKSELLRCFTSDQEGLGSLVFAGRCHHQESLPYKAFDGLIDQITSFLVELSPDARRYLLPRNLEAAARLFPAMAGIPELSTSPTGAGNDVEDEPFEIRRRGFDALRELLRRIGDSHRLVLWIDDLQWADADSAVLLREILRQPEPPRLLLALSYRAEDADTAESHLPIADGSLRLRTIEVGPLADEDARALAVQLMPHTAGDGIEVARLVAESRGVPLFLDQLARHREIASARVPQNQRTSLEDVLTDRLRSLSEEAHSVLAVASVAGQSIERELALRAAGLGSAARPLVHFLEAQALLRTTETGDNLGIETYHDRLREIVIGRMSKERLRQTHLELARSAEATGRQDPNFLYRHYRGAEALELAGDWAVRAAEQADRSLAFLEAARLFAEAEDLLAEDKAHQLQLDQCRATALVNAGHSASAAPVFADAASKRPRAESLHLQRLAAEQYLVSGHIDRGIAQLKLLCAELGVPFPGTTSTALIRMLINIARLRMGGLRFTERNADEIPSKALTTIDLCDSAGKGLVVVDPMRGLYFAFLSLLLALRAGEPRRVARGLCMGGAALSPMGPMARWGREMIDRVRDLGEKRGDPYLLGLAQLALGQCLVVERDWSSVLQTCDRGAKTLEEGSRGTTWERNIGRMAALRALEELGDITELRTRATNLLAEAEDQGDRYSQVVARQNLANWRLAHNDPQGARDEMREAIQLWGDRGYQVQHFYAGRLEAQCDLYEGNPVTASKRFGREWRRARRANLLRHPTVRADALLLRGRIAIANLRATPGRNSSFVRTIHRTIRELRRMGAPDLEAHAVLLEAGLLNTQGDYDRAMRRLASHDCTDQLMIERIILHASGRANQNPRPIFGPGFSPLDPRAWWEAQHPGINVPIPGPTEETGSPEVGLPGSRHPRMS